MLGWGFLVREEHRSCRTFSVQKDWQIWQAYFPEGSFPNLCRDMISTHTAYNWGKQVAHLWTDAEQFLAYVDDAYGGNASQKRDRLTVLVRAAGPYDPVSGQFGGAVPVITQTMNNDLQRAARRGTCQRE